MQVLGYLYISWTKHTERVVFFETSLGNLLYIESNSSLFRFLYEHRPVGSSETRILIRGICFADGRHVEIYWEIRWSVVNASAGLLVHVMDETYREDVFFEKDQEICCISNASLFSCFYEHRPVGSSEPRRLIRGTCFADGRYAEIHWDISRSVVHATAGVFAHSMDNKYIEVLQYIHYIARMYFETLQRWMLLAARVGGLGTIW